MTAFAPHRLVMDLYGAECKHDIRDVGGSDRTFNAPAYECAQCWEDLLLRVYHLGYGDAAEAAARMLETGAADVLKMPVTMTPDRQGRSEALLWGAEMARSLALPVEGT